MTTQTSLPRLARRTRRAVVLVLVTLLLAGQAALGTSAYALPIPGLDDCKEAPDPDRFGTGLVGSLDEAPIGTGTPGSAYDEVGYAGLVWHTYDLGCGPGYLRDSNASTDTFIGNIIFDVAKLIVGAVNGAHWLAQSDSGPFRALDDLVMTASIAMHQGVFTPWFALVAVILGVVLLRHVLTGNLAAIGKRSAYALAALWFASITYLTPLTYTNLLDGVLVDGVEQMQTGVLGQMGIDARNDLPTLLHDQVIYQNWLAGEFGAADSQTAQDLGRDLLRAQAWTKQDVASGAADGSADEKKAAFEDLATRMGPAYSTFQGKNSNRTGPAVGATIQAISYGAFQGVALTGVFLAQLLLRIIVMAGPVIGLVGILFPAVLRKVLTGIGAALVQVLALTAGSCVHLLAVDWVVDPARGIPLIGQIVATLLISVVLWAVLRPGRRIMDMLYAGASIIGASPDSRMDRTLQRLLRQNRRHNRQATARDMITWATRGRDRGAADDSATDGSDGSSRPGLRVPGTGVEVLRPEAAGDRVYATATRVRPYPDDRGSRRGVDVGQPALGPGQRTLTGGVDDQPGTRRSDRDSSAASAPRVIDIEPVAADEDRRDDLFWPSRDPDTPRAESTSAEPDSWTEAERAAPRGSSSADEGTEWVAGAPVDGIYRPSTGRIEVTTRDRGVEPLRSISRTRADAWRAARDEATTDGERRRAEAEVQAWERRAAGLPEAGEGD